MEEQKLREKLQEVINETGFVSFEKPWLVKISEGNYREAIVVGSYHHDHAVLKVTSINDLNYDFLTDGNNDRLSKYYMNLVADRTDVILLANQVWAHCEITTDQEQEIVWKITEGIEGERPISMEKYSQPFGEEEFLKIRKIAETYWRTEAILKDLSLRIPVKESAADYFVERFRKWDKLHYEADLSKNEWLEPREYDSRSKSSIVGDFFRRVDLDLPMYYCWNVFGNTDLLETKDGKLYLVNGRLEYKPFGFAPAAFSWNVGLYNHKEFKEKGDLESLLSIPKELEVAAIFLETCPYFDKNKTKSAIDASLFERFYAALQVDTWMELSPFSSIPEKERWFCLDKCTNNIKGALFALPFIV